MTRTKLLAGNWKMHKTPDETEAFVRRFLPLLFPRVDVEVALLPSFPSLDRTGRLLAGIAVSLGAQDLYSEPFGAFTGEVSAEMLRACGCRYVLVGHSERRALFREDDPLVNRKLKAALAGEIIPILCVGETLTERREKRTEERVLTQLAGALIGVHAESLSSLVVAYEPVWAIGTGEASSPEEAQAVVHRIREWFDALHSRTVANRVRLLYGGSVTPANADSFLREPDVDGALVGGASLVPESFARIVAACPKAA